MANTVKQKMFHTKAKMLKKINTYSLHSATDLIIFAARQRKGMRKVYLNYTIEDVSLSVCQ